MAEAKKGDKVKVHYTGKFEDGTVFDSSEGREPLDFQLGAGQMIPGFEKAVMGMKEGEKKTQSVSAEEGYGDRNDNLLIEVDRSNIPAELNPEVGQQLQVKQADGQSIPVVIAEVNDKSVKLDANHPLAGQDLTFEIELVKID